LWTFGYFTWRKEVFLLFIDDFNRMVWVYFLKEKSEALKQFQSFQNLVETATGEKITTLCTDNGGEFTSSEFNTYFQEKGIRRQLTNSFTPQQNGVT
jgi:transposase InsO family protein